MSADTIARNLEAVVRTKWWLLADIAARHANWADAEDIVQNAFLRVWAKRDQWGDLDDPVSFMTVMVRYSAMKMRPDAAKPAPVLIDFTAGYGEPGYVDPRVFSDDSSDPDSVWGEDNSCSDETRRRAAEALALLSPRERQVVELRWLRGMSIADIPDELGITHGQVVWASRRALAKIRRHFGEPETPTRSSWRKDAQGLTETARARAAEAARLQKAHLSRTQICQQMGLSEGRVRNYLATARSLGLLD